MGVLTIDVQSLVVVLGLIGTIGGMIAALFRLFSRFAKLEAQAAHRQEDSTILLESVMGILDGLIEQGGNGPCHEARDKLVKHLAKN